jgi:peptidylprolyl isomerase
VPEKTANLSVGSRIQIKDGHGSVLNATVTNISDQMVTIDANHPLAGEVLIFDIELIEFV